MHEVKRQAIQRVVDEANDYLHQASVLFDRAQEQIVEQVGSDDPHEMIDAARAEKFFAAAEKRLSDAVMFASNALVALRIERSSQ